MQYLTTGMYILVNCPCQCRSASINNKPSLIGMQLPEIYKENFDVLSESPSLEIRLI
jgi:hypothetical protein